MHQIAPHGELSDLPSLNRGHTVLIVTVTMLCIAAVFVVARMLSRIAIVKHTTWDDHIIVLAWGIAFGAAFAIAYGTGKGLGRHDRDIRGEWVRTLKKCEYAFSVLYNPALMATKTSLLIFYLRLSRNTNKFVTVCSYATLAVVNVVGLVLTFLNIFQCHPLSKTFDPYGGTLKCIPLITLYLVSAPDNIITNLVILVLPIPILKGMHLPRREKSILAMTFGLGIFVTVVDVIRIYYLQQAMTAVLTLNKSVTVTHGLGAEVDFPYNASLSLMWSSVEIDIGIICACVPTLKPLMKHLTPKTISESESESGRDSVRKRTIPDTESDNLSANETPAIEEFRRRSSLEESSDQPGQPAPAHHSQRAGMDLPDFLTAPDAESGPTSESSTSSVLSDSRSNIYFGFINIGPPESMLKLSARESWKYCTAVATLFFLWGFSYGILNTLNLEIVAISHSSPSQGLGLESAYWGAYLFGPLTVGRYALVHHGFKATFIVGLCIYGVGTLIFWPCAVLVSYPGFIISTFLVAFGLSILETAANPFLALCGPPQYGEMRLLLGQGLEATASIISYLISEKAFFPTIRSDLTLINVQWTYLAIALLTVILALIFFYLPVPEATDDDLQEAAQPLSHSLDQPTKPEASTPYIGRFRVIYLTLALGVACQFLYVGTQEISILGFTRFVNLPNLQAQPKPLLALRKNNFVLVGRAAFASSRLLAGGLCLLIRPRVILLVTLVATTAMSIAIVSLPTRVADGNPNMIAGLGIVLFFFEGPVWPLIFALVLRKLGRATKTGAALVTAGAAGGAVGPWVVYAIETGGMNFRRALFVMAIWSGVACVFPGYLCGVRRAREQVDWRGEMEGELGGRIGSGRDEKGRMGSFGKGGEKLRRVSVASGKLGRKIVVGVKEWGRRISLASLSSVGSDERKGRVVEVENGGG